MKKLLLSFLFISAGILLSAQTVENIRVVPDGENLKITYRIGGSTDLQFYTVHIACSMDGGARFEPKAVIGDVGHNIRGGRSFYTIIWNVFEDVDEVINPEIFKYFPQKRIFSLTPFYLDLARKRGVKLYRHDEDYWIDMGRLDSYPDT